MRKFLRHRKNRILAAFVLVLCLLLTLPLIPKGVVQAVRTPLDLTKKCSLTVEPGKNAELKKEDVQIDLYKVARAERVDSYDTYRLVAEGIYSSLKLDQTDNAGWQALAQQAAELALNSNGAEVLETLQSGETFSGLDGGLYLIIARGTGLTDYKSTTGGQLVTKAYSGNKCYTYLPELVALPSTAAELNGQTVTTDSGEWAYDITATLKPEENERYAPLDLVKVLTGYEKNTPATFVFEVQVYESRAAKEAGSEPIDTNVYAIDFDAAGEKQIHIADRIPIGAYVVVTELYSGSFYEPQGSTTQQFEMTEEGGRVTFVNDYSENPPPGDNGGSIVNHFEFEKSESHNGGTGTDEAVNTEGSTGTTGTWQWTQLRDNTAE